MAGRTALQVMEDHTETMYTKDPDSILQDYAEDAIVMTNLCDKPLQGHAAIREFIIRIRSAEILDKMLDNPEEHPIEFLYREGKEGKAIHVFRKKGTPVFGAETYVVENDKVVFETAYINLD